MSTPLSPPPSITPFDSNGLPSHAWVEWTMAVYRQAKKYRGSDTTANRPANTLETGDWYFDTTVGKPIWWNGAAWKYADGTAA